MQSGERVQFGPFAFDPAQFELRKNGIRLKLQDQPAKILSCLLERAGEVVSREELEKLLWPDGTFVDFDSGLNAAINRLRRVLSDSAECPRYIETVARKGYRFIGPIQTSAAPVPSVAPLNAEVLPIGEGGSSPTHEMTNPVAVPTAPFRISYLYLGLFAAAAAGAVAIWPNLPKEKASPAAKSAIARVPFTGGPGMELTPSFSPLGTQIAFAADQDEAGNSDIYVKQVDSSATLRLTSDPAPDSFPAWSPDGKWIAFIRNAGYGGSVFVTDVLGSRERRICHVNVAFGLSWTPDSRYLAAAHRESTIEPSRLLLVDTKDGSLKPLLNAPSGVADYNAAFSPDGKRVAINRCHQSSACDIYLGDVKHDYTVAEPLRRLTWHNQPVHGVVWTGDGKEIVYSSGLGTSYVLWRVDALKPNAEPSPVSGPIESAHYPSVPRLGPVSSSIVAYQGSVENNNLWSVSLDRMAPSVGQPRRLIASSRGNWQPEYSRDGKYLAFTSDRSGANQVWIANADGTAEKRITSLERQLILFPRWSPDGRKLVFSSIRRTSTGESRCLYTVRPDGSEIERITPEDMDAWEPAWSSDGKTVYFISRITGQNQVWKTEISGTSRPVQVTKSGGNRVMEAGGKLHFTATGEGVWIANQDGSGAKKMIPEAGGQLWYAIDDAVIYLAPSGAPNKSELSVFRWDRSSGISQVLGRFPHANPGRITIDPSGTTLTYSHMDSSTVDILLLKDYR